MLLAKAEDLIYKNVHPTIMMDGCRKVVDKVEVKPVHKLARGTIGR